jgi:hypothetical protein
MVIAIGAADRARVGKIRWRRKPAASSPNETYPVGGSQPNVMEKTATRSMPTTNTGMEKPIRAVEEAIGSAKRPRRRAANIPRDTPAAVASNVAGITSWSVRGSRLAVACASDRPRAIAESINYAAATRYAARAFIQAERLDRGDLFRAGGVTAGMRGQDPRAR